MSETPSSGYLKNRSVSTEMLATLGQRPCNRDPIWASHSQRGFTVNPPLVTDLSLIGFFTKKGLRAGCSKSWCFQGLRRLSDPEKRLLR